MDPNYAIVALAIFLTFIFWKAVLKWLLKLNWIPCYAKANFFLQTCKVIFLSIAEAFNPLELTRADFKQCQLNNFPKEHLNDTQLVSFSHSSDDSEPANYMEVHAATEGTTTTIQPTVKLRKKYHG